MAGYSVEIILSTVDKRESFDPIFNLLCESFIAYSYTHLFGNKIKLIIEESDLKQVQDLLCGADRYKVDRITNRYKEK